MARSKEELKKIACAAIDAKRQELITLGDSIFSEPELGFKEVKTAAKIKKIFDKLGFAYTDGVALTGIIAPRRGKESKIKVAVMGEMDTVVMQHNFPTEGEPPSPIKAGPGGGSNGFVGKLIEYVRKEAHAGGAPHD